MRAAFHYLFSVLILSIYGGEVCPYIATLDIFHWLVIISIVLFISFLSRPFILSRFVETAPHERMAARQFYAEFALFIASSLAVTFFDMASYNFPIASGAKIVLGFATLGFFAAADMALQRERDIVAEFARTGRRLSLKGEYISLPQKFSLVASASVLFVTGIAFLVIWRDMTLLRESAQPGLSSPKGAVIVELFFIGSVILFEIINLIVSYSRNLTLFLNNENGTLMAVAAGDLHSSVPVATNDEFGVMADYTNVMIEKLRNRTEELQLTRDVTIHGLATLAETRDNETGQHILRTQRYVRVLASHLKEHPRFRAFLTPHAIELLFKSAPLHDIGKVGIKDSILLKPGRHTPEEFEEMKKHTIYGRDALMEAGRLLGTNSFLRMAAAIAYAHHEKWDGSGYPQGLKGDGIPISGRLMALADVYDALISRRVYKEAFSHEKSRGILLEGRGTHFDPDILDAFLEAEDEFIRIAREYADREPPRA